MIVGIRGAKAAMAALVEAEDMLGKTRKKLYEKNFKRELQ